jgi:hypothetical protein
MGSYMTMEWNGMAMACHGMYWQGIAFAWKLFDMERNGNGKAMPWHGMAWQGMEMAR